MSTTSTISIDLSRLEREIARNTQELVAIRKAIDDALRQLQKISSNTGSLLEASLELERAKSRGELEALEKLYEYTEKTLQETINRYKKMYVKILYDFVNDILNGLEHFVNLCEEELAPLWKIKNYMNMIFEKIDQINPIEEDRELLETAITMYNERRNVADKYVYDLEQIFNRIAEVRETKENFIKNVRGTILNKITLPRNTLVLLKFYTVKVRKKDGTYEYYLVPLARKRETKDVLEPVLQPLKISQKLYEFMTKSIKKAPPALKPIEDEKKNKAVQALTKKTKSEKESQLIVETAW